MADYYVKNGGDDSAIGYSDSEAWETIAKVNSWTFTKGDTINFKRGSTWSGTELLCDNPGISGNYITYQAYSSGALPIIANSGWLSKAIRITGDYVKLRYLKAQDAHEGAVWVIAGGDYAIIEYCEMYNAGAGIQTWANYGEFRYNYIHDLVMVVNDEGGDNDYGASGIWLNASNNEAHHNTLVNCVADSYDYGLDGGAFETFRVSTISNLSIHHNWCYNCRGFMETGGGGLTENIEIYYNVYINGAGTDSGAAHLYIRLPMSNWEVYNNTFIDTVYTGTPVMYIAFDGSPAGEFIFKNNIIYIDCPGRYWYICKSDELGWNWTHEYNSYYKSGTGGYNTLGFTLGTGEIEGNPNFVDLSEDDFNLQSGSPCIDTGTDVSLTQDYEGNIVPYGINPDMGAYEWGHEISIHAILKRA